MTDVEEAMAIIGRTLDVILTTVATTIGRNGSNLRRAVGDLRASAEAAVNFEADLSGQLLTCLDLARRTGASLSGMDRIRKSLLAETPQGLISVAVVQAALRFVIAQEARILALTVFVSREDVDAMITRMNAAFELVELAAADQLDAGSYQAIVGLHGAVTRDLADRSRPLPRIVNYSLPDTVPSLTLANRIYADASRSGELIAENKVVHPAFMPTQGRALSA